MSPNSNGMPTEPRKQLPQIRASANRGSVRYQTHLRIARDNSAAPITAGNQVLITRHVFAVHYGMTQRTRKTSNARSGNLALARAVCPAVSKPRSRRQADLPVLIGPHHCVIGRTGFVVIFIPLCFVL
jgi:hypothetical protein